MTASNLLYLLTHMQSFGTEVIENAYTFLKLDTGTAVDLANAFISDVLPHIRQIQCAQIVTTEVKVINLGNLGDSAEVAVNLAGLLTGEQMLPVFNAIGYTFKPASRAVRPGGKRIAGVPESDQVDGTITNSAYITDMNALKAAYGSNISDDDTNFFAFCIVKRVKTAIPGTTPVKYRYTLPGVGVDATVSELSAVLTSTKVSHQVSRGK